MDSKELFLYCLTKPGAIEDCPDVIVIKVAAKMFALISRRNFQKNFELNT